MARKKATTQKSDTADDAKVASDGKSSKKKKKKQDGWRETIESIVVAFILAFLFRTFEAEAFVIPTGSMAPTLYGRHKDVTCEQCGHHFAVGASDELDKATGYIATPVSEEEAQKAGVKMGEPHRLIGDVVCPNCRYITPKEVVRQLPAFKGDRILVNKYPYEFGNPSRWDVIVFKYPEEPQTNYIKRLIGLPGETIEIHQGDVYARKAGEKQYVILRKDDPSKQNELQILVYDNDHHAAKLVKAGWPERWGAVKRDANSDTGWSADKNGWQQDKRSFTLSANGTRRWLRYRHFVADEDTWVNALNGQALTGAKPRLIADFCGYNAYRGFQHPFDLGTFWVGDLTLTCQVDVKEAGENGEFVIELNEGFRFYRCKFNLSDGTCTIAHSDDHLQLDDPKRNTELTVLGTGESRLKGAGKHQVTFANIDDRLTVWVDGRLIEFKMTDEKQASGVYKRLGGDGSYQPPSNADLAPVGIAGSHCDVTVSKLVLKRDIYYRSEEADLRQDRAEGQFFESFGNDAALRSQLSNPERWWQEYSGEQNLDEILRQRRADGGKSVRDSHGGPAIFEQLADDEYFMMGDNSPRSQDSRLWPSNRKAARRHAVPRRLLVGKAFFIYWPHGIPFLKDGQGIPVRYHYNTDGELTDIPSFRFPFYPNFGRMHRIR